MRLRRQGERVAALDQAPQSSRGAPLPIVVANEQSTQVLYLVDDPDPDRDGTTVEVVGVSHDGLVAVATFEGNASYFEAPGDEALAGHPLAKEGLEPYGAVVAAGSNWIRERERRNSVHPDHDPSVFEALTHYVLTFHDSTFECVARDVAFNVIRGSLARVAEDVVQRLSR